MAERLQGNEHKHGNEHKESSQDSSEKLKHKVEVAETTKHEAKDAIESIRASIDKEAASKTENEQSEKSHDKDTGNHPVYIDRNEKNRVYKKELRKVRSQLKPQEKAFSKLVHSRPVEVISEFGGKTIARPSGLLGGGFVALVGTSLLVWASKHYGFTYNYTVFLLLLAGGFIAGLVAEFVLRSLSKKA